MPKANLADRVFLTADSEETPQHVACLATFIIPDDAPGDYVRRLADRLRAQATFASPFNYRLRRVALRKVAPTWQIVPDDQIDIDYHFRHSALPAPGGERELGVLISRLHSRPLDPTRPLWEYHLIEGLDRNRFALYFKVHHALIDGVGGVKRMQQTLTSDPRSDEAPALWTIGPRVRNPRAAANAARGQRIRRAMRATREGALTAAGLAKAAVRLVALAQRNSESDVAVPFVAPQSVINRRIGRQRRVATQLIEFDLVRQIASASGVKINDVFLAACAGGLRRYLHELDALPDKSLTAGTPVNIRIDGDDTTTNAFSMVVVKLGTEIADPLVRLRAIARSNDAAKDELRRLPKTLQKLYPSLFMAPFVGQNLVGIGGRTNPPYNVSISNVPGPLEPKYLAGARMEAMYPLALLYHGVGLFVALFAASGRLGVGFVGDRDGLPHLQRLAVYTGDAMDELADAVGVTARALTR
ncbi:WS/DGAT/MGAT family O-acyltransferase [Hoyosella subflava]|uniref:Diacylglycerol O-acyltransferase n=1 Tax=Hoyosella subflava (strain DSM 45089 / JCM 17490 / NBRC 109087 / DQS3-9A1) TaxID=443218 RepID=F6EQZ0_HOYSD|nr:wax ester/triacylglycerol synthase family O-acyltransferase [Hoyosella subflava]AEF40677.1 Acyltransferase [Hoyosella subflava DQS3-9A1]